MKSLRSFLNGKGWALVAASLVALLECTGCGSSSSGASGPTSLSQLPTATGAVASSSGVAKEEERAFPADGVSWLESATTGTLVKNWSSVTWGASTSGAMCQVGNMTSNLLSEAGNADRMMCYGGAMQAAGLFPSTVDDGNVHYLQLTGMDNGGSGLKLKVQIVKSGGVIQTFKMWTCENTTTTNDSYDGFTSSGGTVTLVSVSNHTGNQGSGAQRTTVTGTINSSGAWLTKVINSDGNWSSSGSPSFSMGQSMQLTQFAAYAELSGYFTGTFGGNTQTGRIFSDFAILAADKLTTFAIGNGTLASKFTFTGGGPSDSSMQYRAWLGDTDAYTTATSSDYYSNVSSATLPTVGTPSTDYQTGETWDCQATGTTFTSIDMSSTAGAAVMSGGIATCDANLRLSSHGWVNCNSADYTH